MLLGAVAYQNPGTNIIDVATMAFDNPFIIPFPTIPSYIFICLLIAAIIDIYMWEQYLLKAGVVTNPNGDASFEEDYLGYDREFVIDPQIVQSATNQEPKTYYTNEHKKVVTSPKITNKQNKRHQYTDNIYAACWQNTQIYADKVALSLNGKWSQRNSNAVIFGASGSGKSRYFLNPNLLQYNSNYIVTDPSGEIMAGYGAGLRKHNYIVKCLNVSEMTKSCRFNPLYYIRDASDIPVIVTTLMTNTQQAKNTGGDADFWQKTTQALLCAIIGYLYEVEPIERRNFYNVLEILRLAQIDENDTQTEETEFDRMFERLGQKNPNSYAFHQYETYHLAPRKTALNILISTAVLISTYIDIPEFNNLTYKDELELDKFGAAPFKLKKGVKLFPEDAEKYKRRYSPNENDSGELPPIPRGYIDVEDFEKYAYHRNENGELECLIEQDKQGRYIEGEPYKVAVFLAIPTADTTYNWLTAMLYSVVFKLVYRRGETRAKQQAENSPELALHARFLIDECANIGKIPNLQEYLATCRKYKISIVPIFQSFSQIIKVYGKEDANSIIANCDTTLFLGGVDSDTLKIVCDRLGKETVKSLSTGKSNGGRNRSASQNIQNVGRELMSRIQVEQMSNSECIVLIRALKPFKVKKFALQDHPNYKYTAEANPKEYSFINPFRNDYSDAAIEAIRIKKAGEIGYIEPKEIESARLRALKNEGHSLRMTEANSLVKAAKTYGTSPPDTATNTEKKAHEQYITAVTALFQKAKEEQDKDVLTLLKDTIVQYGLRIPLGDIDIINMGTETKSSEEHEEDLRRAQNRITIDRDKQNLELLNARRTVIVDTHNAIRAEFGKDLALDENSSQLLDRFFASSNKEKKTTVTDTSADESKSTIDKPEETVSKNAELFGQYNSENTIQITADIPGTDDFESEMASQYMQKGISTDAEEIALAAAKELSESLDETSDSVDDYNSLPDADDFYATK